MPIFRWIPCGLRRIAQSHWADCRINPMPMDQLASLIRIFLERANALVATVLCALAVWLLQTGGYLNSLPDEVVQTLNLFAIFAAMLLITGAVAKIWRWLRSIYRAYRQSEDRRAEGLRNFVTMPDRFRTTLAYIKNRNQRRFLAYPGDTLVREMVLHGLIDPDEPFTLHTVGRHDGEAYFVVPDHIWQKCEEEELGRDARGIPNVGIRLAERF